LAVADSELPTRNTIGTWRRTAGRVIGRSRQRIDGAAHRVGSDADANAAFHRTDDRERQRGRWRHVNEIPSRASA
jgi:hypothetical protein